MWQVCDIRQLARVDHHIDFVIFIASVSLLSQLTEKHFFVEVIELLAGLG